ncbi:hypothetical protein LCL96_04215 [Rossellomorea aquimaris]|uniref:phage tail spike protein n=1 Tax=Rossellomorea aquimaris TaxID=189382 RepID=UPI001CD4D7D3|nr:phage tail spike protein [Rossellomorea aquimaris]MCA1058122.1 hypothetical protein [Rossellomorea aquimaris]
MSMIHLLHHQTDKIVGWISNVTVDSHQLSITNEETFDFTVPFTEKGVEKLSEKRRIIIPSEDGDYREFIVEQSEEYTGSNSVEVKSIGSFIELKKLKWIPPQILEGQTAENAGKFILEGLPWEIGIVEYSGIRKWTIEKDINAYDALKAVASLFDCELRFRVVVTGSEVVARYVDIVKRVGMDRGKEIVAGKDLFGIRKRVNYNRIVTALICLGPEREDGTRLRVTVTDDDAYQNWNQQGQHLIELYEPESQDRDMTEERLTQLGNTELKKRITAAVEYEVEGAALDHILGYSHEKVRLGDTAKIKDEKFVHPMYLDSRVIFVDRSIFDKSKKTYKLGEVIEYKKEDVFRVWKDLQALYATKVIKAPDPPEGKMNIIWIQTGGKVYVAHTWNASTGKWEKITPTEASEVGSYTQEEIDIKDQATYQDGTYYSDQVAQTAQENAKQYTKTYAVDKSIYTQKVQDIEDALTKKVSKLLYDNDLAILQQDIADKAELEYVNGQLVSKADKDNTYTKTEVNNQLDSKVSNTEYTTDQDGIVTQLTNHDSRINQTEQGLTSKVSQTTYNQKVSSLETQISQANTLIKQNSQQVQLKASQSDLDTLKGRVSSTESSLTVQVGLIESKVSQTEFEKLQIGGRNYVPNSTKFKLNGNAPGVIPTFTPEGYLQIFSQPDNGNYCAFYFSGTEWSSVEDYFVDGEEVTVSFEMKSPDHKKNPKVYVKPTMSYYPTLKGNMGTGFIQLSVTMIWKKDSTINMHLGFSNIVGTTIIRNMKIEKGNKSTSWTPAPEDTQGQIDGISGRMSSAETTITQNTTAIGLKASQSSVDSLAGRVSNAESSLIVQAGQIASKVSKTEFDNLEIGGRNLLKDSRTIVPQSNNSSSYPISCVFQSEGGREFYRVKRTNTTVNPRVISLYNGITPSKITQDMKGKSITFSFLVRASHNVSFSTMHYMDTDLGKIPLSGDGKTTQVSTEWKRISFTSQIDTAISNINVIRFSPMQSTLPDGIVDSFYLDICEFKIEEGTKSSAWTPAPEDTQEQINIVSGRVTSAESSITQLSNQIQSKVEQTSFNALSGRVSTAESTITQQAGLIEQKVSKNGVMSAISQTSEVIKIAASKIQFDGAIFGQNAKFAGSIVSTDGNNTLKIDGESVSINDREIFDSESTLPSMYDGNLSYPVVASYGKMYLQEITFTVPSGIHSPGFYLEKTLNITNYVKVAIPEVKGVFCQAVAKEWYSYENDSARVYGGGDIMSTKIRISPHFQYTTGGHTVKVYIMLIGYR